MEYSEVVRKRRMVRSFTDEPVAVAAVERILDTARRGPSAGHSQGVEFVVVTDDRTRSTIARGFERVRAVSGHKNFVAQAKVHIVICANEEAYKERYREPDKMRVRADISDDDLWTIPYWYTDAGCAMMLLLLAAVDEGLAAAFVGFGHGEAPLRALLGVPDEHRIVGAVLLGHEAPDAREFGDISADPRPRRPLAEVVHRERW
jgi:nitroreductase